MPTLMVKIILSYWFFEHSDSFVIGESRLRWMDFSLVDPNFSWKGELLNICNEMDLNIVGGRDDLSS